MADGKRDCRRQLQQRTTSLASVGVSRARRGKPGAPTSRANLPATELVAGFELEAWLIDEKLLPVPGNVSFLARMASPLVVPELSQFNVELNGTPQPLHGNALSRLEDELTATWQQCLKVAGAEADGLDRHRHPADRP
jgi:hypothetical protein